MESNAISHRSFIGKATVTAGLTALGADNLFGKPDESHKRMKALE